MAEKEPCDQCGKPVDTQFHLDAYGEMFRFCNGRCLLEWAKVNADDFDDDDFDDPGLTRRGPR